MEVESAETKKTTGSKATKKSKARTPKVQGKAASLEPKVSAVKNNENEMINSEEDGEFQLVRRKQNKKTDEAKLEKLKVKKPDKSFIISVGENGVTEAKKNFRSEIVKKVNAPQVKGTYVLPRGDLLIKPGDEKTYEALRGIQGGGGFVIREEGPKWPKVLI